MAKVIMYTTQTCPYCVAAKNLLDGKGVAYQTIDLTNDFKGREELLKKSNGQRTVPQIFINERHIGGFTDLKALEEKGELDPLLL